MFKKGLIPGIIMERQLENFYSKENMSADNHEVPD